MFDKEFDELFQTRLKDHPSAVPEDMWHRISGGTNVRRGGNLWRWYLLVPVVLVAGLVFRPHSPAPQTSAVSAPHPPSLPVPQTSSAPAPQTSSESARRPPSAPIPPTPSAYAPQTSAVSAPHPPSLPVPQTSSGSASHTPSVPAPQTHSVPATLTSSDRTPQTHSVPVLSITRSGPAPRSHSGPGFFTKSARTSTPYDWQASIVSFSHSFQPPFAPRLKGKPVPCPAPDDLKENSGWFIEGYFSPDYLFTSNRHGFSYSAGARVGKEFNDRLSATIGLQFSHVSLGPIPDSIPVQQFNNIDVPALLGYQLGSGDFYTLIHAGVIWNLHSKPVFPDYGATFRSNTGMALYFGLDFLKKLNTRWSIFAEPHYRYQLTNRTANILQSPDLGGVSFGARFNFTRRAGRQ